MVSVFARHNSSIVFLEVDNYFNDTYVFDKDKLPGLQVAFAFTDFEDNFEM